MRKISNRELRKRYESFFEAEKPIKEDFQKDAQEAVAELRKKIPPEVKSAAAKASANLYYGPSSSEGFEENLDIVREWADENISDIYYNTFSGEISDYEPQPEVDEDGNYYDEGDWIHLEARDVLRALFGTELALYIY